MEEVNATLAEAANALGGKNETEKIPATPEGMAVAYTSLVIMSLLPIFYGSYKSVKLHTEQKVCEEFHAIGIKQLCYNCFWSKRFI